MIFIRSVSNPNDRNENIRNNIPRGEKSAANRKKNSKSIVRIVKMKKN